MTARDTQRRINRLVRPRKERVTLPATPTKGAIAARTGLATPADARQAGGGGFSGITPPLKAIKREYDLHTTAGTGCEFDYQRDVILHCVDANDRAVVLVIPRNVESVDITPP